MARAFTSDTSTAALYELAPPTPMTYVCGLRAATTTAQGMLGMTVFLSSKTMSGMLLHEPQSVVLLVHETVLYAPLPYLWMSMPTARDSRSRTSERNLL